MGCCATKNKIGVIKGYGPSNDTTVTKAPSRTRVKNSRERKTTKSTRESDKGDKTIVASVQVSIENNNVTIHQGQSGRKEKDPKGKDVAAMFQTQVRKPKQMLQDSADMFQVVPNIRESHQARQDKLKTAKPVNEGDDDNDVKYGSIHDLDLEICDDHKAQKEDLDDDINKLLSPRERNSDEEKAADMVPGFEEGLFSNITGTPELQRKKVHVIPTGRREKEEGTPGIDEIGRTGRMRLGGTSDIVDKKELNLGQGQDEGQQLHDLELEEAELGIKEDSTDGLDLTSNDSDAESFHLASNADNSKPRKEGLLQMLLNEEQDVAAPPSSTYGQFHFGSRKNSVTKPDKEKDKAEKTTGRKATLSTTNKSKYPEIIQVASAETSKTKYSYQFSPNRPTEARPKSSKGIRESGNSPTVTNRRRGLIHVAPSENPGYLPQRTQKQKHEQIDETEKVTFTNALTDSVDLFPNSNAKGDVQEEESSSDSDPLEKPQNTANHLNVYGGQMDRDERFSITLTPERSRKMRPKSSYSIRKSHRNLQQLVNTAATESNSNEYSNITASHEETHHDVTDNDVTVNITSSKASKVLGLDSFSTEATRGSRYDAVSTPSGVTTNKQSLDVPKEPHRSMLGSRTKPDDYLVGAGSRGAGRARNEAPGLPQWSRYLPS